jgi:hypothetical protein
MTLEHYGTPLFRRSFAVYRSMGRDPADRRPDPFRPLTR